MKTLLRQHPGFVGGLLALGVAGLVAIAVLVERAQTVTRVRREMDRNRQNVHALLLRAPDPEALRHTSDELMGVRRQLMDARTAFQARAAQVKQPVPGTTAAAFFDLEEFGQRMRERARQAGVRVLADERFGFGEHANVGPEPEMIAGVFRQRLIVEHLLDALWRASPDELVAVRRERPRRADGAEREGRDGSRTGDRRGSFLVLEPAVSARKAGEVEATAFRLEFIGHTPALRSLLNSIAEHEWPFSVRLVEASPPERREREHPLADESGAGLFVRPEPMKFAVTIEFIEVPLADAAGLPSA